MSMELNIDAESKFILEMKIDGEVSSNRQPSMRFSIAHEKVLFSLCADRVDNGIYEISVPKLRGIFEPGTYDASVEVFIDGKHFTPLTETVKLIQEVKPVVTIPSSTASSTAVAPSEPKIEIKRPIIRKTDEVVRKSK